MDRWLIKPGPDRAREVCADDERVPQRGERIVVSRFHRVPLPPECGSPPGGDAATASASTVPVYASKDLMARHDEIRIVHEGVVYRLRRTATGKLILTK